MVARRVLLLGICASGAIADAAPSGRVLADRVIDAHRQISLVAVRDGGCVGASELRVSPPFSLVANSACVVEISGPVQGVPEIRIGAALLATGLGPPLTAKLPALPTRRGRVVELVPEASMPVGRDALAAYLVATNNGRPASDVELTIVADGARPRALRWVKPGIARVELLVATYRPNIELVVDRAGAPSLRATIAIDPGPPAEIELAVPRITAGRPFSLAAHVRTRDGVELPEERVRVEAIGCTHVVEAFTCPAGPATIRVALSIGADWVPIEERRVDSIAELVIAAPAPRSVWGWAIALRGGRDRAWREGLAASLVRVLTPDLRGLVELGWQHGAPGYRGVAPVAGDLALGEHAFELLAGVRYLHGPWSARVAGGTELVRQHAAIAATGASSFGLRAIGLATIGAQLPVGHVSFGADAGIRIGRDLIAPDWPLPGAAFIVEVSLAGAL